MDLVAILRVLCARRIVTGVGIIVAVSAGMLAGHKAAARTAVGGGTVSSLALMLDTQKSQLLTAAPDGAWSLPTRASLLAEAVTSDMATGMIARRAGVTAAKLAVLGPSAKKIPVVDSPLVSRVYPVASTSAAPYVVNVLADGMTPIIKVAASAPNAARAARLARAADAVLREMFVRNDAHHSRGFVLDTIAPLRTKRLPAPRSQARLLMVGGTFATFALWCAGVVLAAGLAGRLRAHVKSPRTA